MHRSCRQAGRSGSHLPAWPNLPCKTVCDAQEDISTLPTPTMALSGLQEQRASCRLVT